MKVNRQCGRQSEGMWHAAMTRGAEQTLPHSLTTAAITIYVS
jgi:hypothetical protein